MTRGSGWGAGFDPREHDLGNSQGDAELDGQLSVVRFCQEACSRGCLDQVVQLGLSFWRSARRAHGGKQGSPRPTGGVRERADLDVLDSHRLTIPDWRAICAKV